MKLSICGYWSLIDTVRTGIKGMSLKIIDSFRSKKRSFTPGMSGLNTDFARRVAFRISLRLDNIRRWRLGRVRGILRKFNDLISKFSINFNKFGSLYYDLECVIN